MAKAAPSACTHPGCPELVVNGSQCAKHKKERVRDYRSSNVRAQLEAFYGGGVWRALSKAYRKRNPLCEQCAAQGLTTLADVTDHIIEIRDDWERRYDPSNLQALCHTCHNRKTAAVSKQRAIRKR